MNSVLRSQQSKAWGSKHTMEDQLSSKKQIWKAMGNWSEQADSLACFQSRMFFEGISSPNLFSCFLPLYCYKCLLQTKLSRVTLVSESVSWRDHNLEETVPFLTPTKINWTFTSKRHTVKPAEVGTLKGLPSGMLLWTEFCASFNKNMLTNLSFNTETKHYMVPRNKSILWNKTVL